MGSDNGTKKTLGIGLSHENLERLKAGKPIIFCLKDALGSSGHLSRLTDEDNVFIFSGESENSMYEVMKRHLDDKTEVRDYRLKENK